MKYEHLGIDMSHDACARVEQAIKRYFASDMHALGMSQSVRIELENFANNLRARLQREDSDPKVPACDTHKAHGGFQYDCLDCSDALQAARRDALPGRSASAPVADDAWLA